MASSRPRRANAGSKMASLLNQEEAALLKGDDFYATKYGGFGDEKEDGDFRYQSPNEEDDAVDSDFSIDEDDEVRSDVEGDEEGKRRVRRRAEGVVTKAYREPKRDQRPKGAREAEAADKKRPKKARRPQQSKPGASLADFGRKEARASTISKTAETVKRQRERELKARRQIRKKMAALKRKRERGEDDGEREPTQEERLEEAKLTERLNLASLKRFEEMEMEAKRKAVKLLKREVKGPYIRYLSTSMPLIQEMPPSEEKIVVDDIDDGSKEEKIDEAGNREKTTSKEKHERTFITFSDFDTYRTTMPKTKPRIPQQKICPITRLPAKYFDPVTRLPYANLQAFKFLRTHYYNHLDMKGDRDDPEVAEWTAWRQKNKHLHQQMQQQQQQSPQVHHHQVTSRNSANSGFSPLLARSVSVPQQPVALPTQPSPQVQQQHQSLHMKGGSVGAAGSLPVTPVATIAQQQSVVLPVRTTPLSGTATVQSANFVASAPTLPTQPSAAVAPLQTVRIATPTGTTQVQLPRSVSAASLTPQQIQRLATSPGNVLSNALQSALRGTGAVAGTRAQFVARPQGPPGVQQQQILRTTGARPGGPIAIQRPVVVTTGAPQQIIGGSQQSGGTPVAVAVANAQARAAAAAGRTATVGQQQLIVSGQQPRQQIVVAGTPGTAGGAGGATRQVVVAGSGQPVRAGQILQLAGQGGTQHQIVVSQSGQLVLNPVSTSATTTTTSNVVNKGAGAS